LKYERGRGSYRLSPAELVPTKADAIVCPLLRVYEISPDVEEIAHSKYFKCGAVF